MHSFSPIIRLDKLVSNEENNLS